MASNDKTDEIVDGFMRYVRKTPPFENVSITTAYATKLCQRIKAAHKRELEAGAEAAQICGEIGEMIGREATDRQPVTDCNRVGNAAKMREALSDACYAMFNFLKTQNGGYEEMAKALDKAKAALAIPPRNCDRPECATTRAAQEVWRKEDAGKTAYYEWLLATSTT